MSQLSKTARIRLVLSVFATGGGGGDAFADILVVAGAGVVVGVAEKKRTHV